MKIALSQNEVASLSASSAQAEAMSQAVDGCKKGDWEAKRSLERLFLPLITMLAEKRAGNDSAARNAVVEHGKAGLNRAAKRFPQREPIRRFRLFALNYIESEMDKPGRGKRSLFG
jgi:DNA-directed RNA polymerase specialized sigma subunit